MSLFPKGITRTVEQRVLDDRSELKLLVYETTPPEYRIWISPYQGIIIDKSDKSPRMTPPDDKTHFYTEGELRKCYAAIRNRRDFNEVAAVTHILDHSEVARRRSFYGDDNLANLCKD